MYVFEKEVRIVMIIEWCWENEYIMHPEILKMKQTKPSVEEIWLVGCVYMKPEIPVCIWKKNQLIKYIVLRML